MSDDTDKNETTIEADGTFRLPGDLCGNIEGLLGEARLRSEEPPPIGLRGMAWSHLVWVLFHLLAHLWQIVSETPHLLTVAGERRRRSIAEERLRKMGEKLAETEQKLLEAQRDANQHLADVQRYAEQLDLEKEVSKESGRRRVYAEHLLASVVGKPSGLKTLHVAGLNPDPSTVLRAWDWLQQGPNSSAYKAWLAEKGYDSIRPVVPAPAAQGELDWTTGADGRTNSSPVFKDAAQHVERIIRENTYALIDGRVHDVAGQIVAQLAHVKGLAPQSEARLPRGLRARERGQDEDRRDVCRR
jgi:hypothetical protein